ncbi:hypothetical protein ACFL0Q_08585 [Thermodesulfobacteriota bacterium]
MRRQRLFSGCLGLAVLVLIMCGTSSISAAEDVASLLKIEGNPLEIHADHAGTMGVFRWQDYHPYNTGCTPETPCLTRQYYSEYATYSVLFLGGASPPRFGTDYLASGPDLFVPVTHTMPDPWTIVTVFNAGDTGVQTTQTVSYVNGNAYYRIEWQIANNGGQTFTDVRFFHGGDTYFAGDDSSIGHYDPLLNMVYLTNPDLSVSGIMGLYGGVGSAADYYREGYFGSEVADVVWNIGQLDNQVRNDYHDAGYALQWNRATLSPGQTWTITAFEKWTEAGLIQVLAPASQAIAPGQTLTFPFTLQNFQNVTDTFDLQLQSSNGWTVNLPGGSTATVASGASETVNAQLTAPGGVSEGVVDTLTLTATSQSDGSVFNSDATSATVEIDLPTQPGGTGIQNYRLVSVPKKDLPGSTLGQVIASGVPDGLTLGESGDLRIFRVVPNGDNPEYEELMDGSPPFFPSEQAQTMAQQATMDLAGKAFWRIVRDTQSFDYAGAGPNPINGDFEIVLTPGWNVFGFPFDDAEEIDVADLRVREDGTGTEYALDDPANTLTSSTVWEYEDRDEDGEVDEIDEVPVRSLYDPATYIARGYGYWLYVESAVNVILGIHNPNVPGGAMKEPAVVTGLERAPSAARIQAAAAESAPPPPPASLDSSASPGSPAAASGAAGGGGGCFIDTVFSRP